MIPDKKQRLVLYSLVAGLAVLSFLTAYKLTSSNTPDGQKKYDAYSQDTYNNGAIKNYKDSNPYGSFFVGFDELLERGVSNTEYIYTSDVLTNFTMYTEHVFNGKVSFVKDSFVREFTTNNSHSSYSFKFSINDSSPYIMSVVSDSINKTISFTVKDSQGRVRFEKNFTLNTADEAV